MPQLDLLILSSTAATATIVYWFLYLYFFNNFLFFLSLTFNIRNYLKNIFLFNNYLFLNNYLLLSVLKIKLFLHNYIKSQLINIIKIIKINFYSLWLNIFIIQYKKILSYNFIQLYEYMYNFYYTIRYLSN